MPTWSIRHVTSVWCFLLLLVSGFGWPNDELLQTGNATGAVLHSETTRTDSTKEASQNVPLQDTTRTADLLMNHQNGTGELSRGERMMLVYVKPNSSFELRNVTELPDMDAFDGVLIKEGGKETIVITDAGGEYEDEHEHGDDLLLMEARSLGEDRGNATGTDPPQRNEQVTQVTKMKDLLDWSGALNLTKTGTGHLKMNVASLLANEYKEMYDLMNENLSKDTAVFMRANSGSAFSAGVPRESQDDMTGGQASSSGDDLESSGSAPQPMYIAAPPSSFVRNGVQRSPPPSEYRRQSIGVQPAPKARPRVQQTRRPNERFDAASPRVTETNSRNEGTMVIVPSETMMRFQRLSSSPTALPNTAVQWTRGPTMRRRPQPQRNATTVASPFGRRIPRPTQHATGMSTPALLQQSQLGSKSHPMYFHSPAAPVASASSQIASVKRFAPNLYYLRQPSQNSTTQTRNQVTTQTAPNIPNTHNTGNKPSLKMEYGARLRPMIRLGASRNSTLKRPVETDRSKAGKEQRDAKMNQLRSNLVGKLVVIQSMLDEKLVKSEKIAAGRGNAPDRLHLGGLLKPIKPLRPPTRPDSTTSPTTITTAAANEPLLVLNDKRKYRRPPSLRKAPSKAPSVEAGNEDESYTASASLRQSVVISSPKENATFLEVLKNSTTEEKSANLSRVAGEGLSWDADNLNDTATNVVTERILNGNSQTNLTLSNNTKTSESSSQRVDVTVEKKLTNNSINCETGNSTSLNPTQSIDAVENIALNISHEKPLGNVVKSENSSNSKDEVLNVKLISSTEKTFISSIVNSSSTIKALPAVFRANDKESEKSETGIRNLQEIKHTDIFEVTNADAEEESDVGDEMSFFQELPMMAVAAGADDNKSSSSITELP